MLMYRNETVREDSEIHILTCSIFDCVLNVSNKKKISMLFFTSLSMLTGKECLYIIFGLELSYLYVVLNARDISLVKMVWFSVSLSLKFSDCLVIPYSEIFFTFIFDRLQIKFKAFSYSNFFMLHVNFESCEATSFQFYFEPLTSVMPPDRRFHLIRCDFF